MKTAAGALTKLTQNCDDQQDEWDVFGMDVANSLRALKNPDCQRQAKLLYNMPFSKQQKKQNPHFLPQQ